MSIFTELHLPHSGIILKNRIGMSAMCQYSAIDGFANPWHLVHLGTRAVGGCSVIMQEATAVHPAGRISYADLGLWKDQHIEKLQEITSFIQAQGSIAGIQLAHAGRKASCEVPWQGGAQVQHGENSWTTFAPSALSFKENDRIPRAMSLAEISSSIADFAQAAQRAVQAGYQIIEIHAAHGYLIHQFLSPITNKRTDEYGGSFENRARFLIEIIDAIKAQIPADISLWVRISATDWVDDEPSWDLQQSIRLAQHLAEKQIDLIDVSTGGLVAHAAIPTRPSYQVPFAQKIKEQVPQLRVAAVGLITEARQAEGIIQENRADLVLLGRELLRNPYFVLSASAELNSKYSWKKQYERAQ